MSNDKDNLLEQYKQHASDNEIEILRSHQCGCFFCCHTFDARKVSNWASEQNGGASALCPECGMPAVIGDASGVPLNEELLKQMNAAFYGGGVTDSNSALSYADLYMNFKIAHNAQSEQRFERCISLLASEGNAHANFLMGQMYSGKAEFHKPDIEIAKAFFSDKSLRNNSSALCRLGFLLVSTGATHKEKMSGYECLAKASAFGCLGAIALMADCYVLGDPVKKDADFAYSVIRDAFIDLYPDYVSSKLEWTYFPELPLRLATYYYDGVACQKDHVMALRYFLLAKLATNFRNGMINQYFDATCVDCSEIIDSSIKKIAEELGAKGDGQPVLDADTFYDTYGDTDMIEDSDKTLELIKYNPTDMTLSFSITTKSPGLIFDVGNLCCVQSGEKMQWNFEEVVSFKFLSPGNPVFNLIKLQPDGDGWDFVRKDQNGNSINVASIRFAPMDSFKNILSSEKKKATGKKKTPSVKKKAPKGKAEKKEKKE